MRRAFNITTKGRAVGGHDLLLDLRVLGLDELGWVAELTDHLWTRCIPATLRHSYLHACTLCLINHLKPSEC